MLGNQPVTHGRKREGDLFIEMIAQRHLAGDEIVQIVAFAGLAAGHGFPLAEQFRRIGALRVAGALGLKVPDDLGIVATVDSQGMRSATPTLTAIENHPRELGSRAIKMLVGLLNGEVKPPVGEIVPAELQVRESTSRP